MGKFIVWLYVTEIPSCGFLIMNEIILDRVVYTTIMLLCSTCGAKLDKSMHPYLISNQYSYCQAVTVCCRSPIRRFICQKTIPTNNKEIKSLLQEFAPLDHSRTFISLL